MAMALSMCGGRKEADYIGWACLLHQFQPSVSSACYARLALALIRSLEPTDEGDIEEAWRVEVETRWESVEHGGAETIAAPEVFAEIRRALR
jgi:hypothetical protein